MNTKDFKRKKVRETFKEMSEEQLIEYVARCPFLLDQATVPKAGIDAAPEQVVINMSIPWLWYERVIELVKKRS